MEKLALNTEIKAPIARVFDLARSVDLFQLAQDRKQQVKQLFQENHLLNESQAISWSAKLAGLKDQFTALITKMNSPHLIEEQLNFGHFVQFKHKRFFEEKEGKTIIRDEFIIDKTAGKLGVAFDLESFKQQLKKTLKHQYKQLKRYAENEEQWMQILNIF